MNDLGFYGLLAVLSLAGLWLVWDDFKSHRKSR